MTFLRRISQALGAAASVFATSSASAHVGDHAAMGNSDIPVHLVFDSLDAVLGLASLAFALIVVVSLLRLPSRRRTTFDLRHR